MIQNKRFRIIVIILASASLVGLFLLLKFFRETSKPNILLISIDCLRPDHLGCYGYKRNTSPNIDKLAEEGVLFTQAISQSSWTSSSISSILTSLYPSHELIEAGYSLSEQNHNLVKILKSNRYFTALFSDAEPILSITLNNIKNTFDIFYVKDEKLDTIIERVNNWLSKNNKFPFFLWVHIFEPHWPYKPPPFYYTDFLSDNLYPKKIVPICSDDGIKNEFYSFGAIPRIVAENGITNTRYYIAKYDGEIRFADEQIGNLLNQLKKLKLINKTLIVICADHGESMGEHNFYFNHSHFLYEELIKVPLMIVFPKKIPKNKIIIQQVQLIDIMPTIFDFVQIKFNITAEGKSLVPLIMGKTHSHDVYAFSESPFYPSPQCIRTENWKLIYNRKWRNYELYNLKEDPQESKNLIREHIEIANNLKRRLDEPLKNNRCHQIDNKIFLSEKEINKLRSLGYVQ